MSRLARLSPKSSISAESIRLCFWTLLLLQATKRLPFRRESAVYEGFPAGHLKHFRVENPSKEKTKSFSTLVGSIQLGDDFLGGSQMAMQDS